MTTVAMPITSVLEHSNTGITVMNILSALINK